jgi:hypothetical protein
MARKNPSLEFDDEKFQLAMRKVPNLLEKSLRFGLEQIGDDFVETMQNVFTGQESGEFRGNGTPDKLINRTGALRRSIRGPIVTGSTADTLEMRVSIGDSITAHYVRIQEEGGKIRPKRAKALTIPLPDNKTSAGRVRFTRARDVPGGFLLNTKGGKAFIVSEQEGELKFWFMLADEVRIPARLGFRRRWRAQRADTYRIRVLNQRVQKALEKAGLA